MNETARAKAFGKLHAWLLKQKESYNRGEMMSIAESMYSEAVVDEVIRKMEGLLSEEICHTNKKGVFKVSKGMKERSNQIYETQEFTAVDIAYVMDVLSILLRECGHE